MITVSIQHYRETSTDGFSCVGTTTIATDVPKVALDACDNAHDDDEVTVDIHHTFDVDQGRALLRAWGNNFGL